MTPTGAGAGRTVDEMTGRIEALRAAIDGAAEVYRTIYEPAQRAGVRTVLGRLDAWLSRAESNRTEALRQQADGQEENDE